MLTKQNIQDLKDFLDYATQDGKELRDYVDFAELPESWTDEQIEDHARKDQTNQHVLSAIVRLYDLLFEVDQ